MSPYFTPVRIATFVVCVAIFWILGGFEPLGSGLSEDFQPHVKMQKAWIYCIVAFLTGAVCVSFIEHKIGHVDPVNLRVAYIIFGVALMLLGILWHHSLVSGLEQRFGTSPR
ncbi:MAG: H+/Cl- antiporter ClcA [Verrucomicrobiales bacterium]|jgi:H+/Cl- antiporter ClcA